jgi:hypothetical protein
VKLTLILSFLMLISSAIASPDPAKKIYNGYKYKTLKNAKVTASKWLDEIEVTLEARHDFLENVSYVGEERGDVAEFCEWSEQELEENFDYSEIFTATIWNKIINKKGESKGYILYLFAEISGCEYPRGTYIVGKDGKEIDTETFWVLDQIDLGTYLQNKVIK